MSIRSLAAALALSASLAACATGPSSDQVRAPQPAKSVDLERFYAGRWLEIARLPMGMTDGCVAGASTYTLTAQTQVDVRDTCQVGTPEGREKAIGGRGEIMDPGTNAKMRVRYFWGFVTWDYWVLDHADDYSWFTRRIRPSRSCGSTPARFRRRENGPRWSIVSAPSAMIPSASSSPPSDRLDTDPCAASPP